MGSRSSAGADRIPHEEGETFLSETRSSSCRNSTDRAIFAPRPIEVGNRKGFGLEEEVW